jgi:phosphoribosylanthranilate isomerase
MKVKICGITREEDIASAVSCGADAVGFVVGFRSSPRDLSLRRAGELIARVPPLVDSVLVTTGETLLTCRREVEEICPDAVQVYGSGVRAPDLVPRGAALILPYFVGSDGDHAEPLEGYDILLTTSHPADSAGGTGSMPDLESCAGVRRNIFPKPLMLSGGLKPENVKHAIGAVRPYAVDVSSGVESAPGRKDEGKMREFVRNAKGADFD